MEVWLCLIGLLGPSPLTAAMTASHWKGEQQEHVAVMEAGVAVLLLAFQVGGLEARNRGIIFMLQ